MKTEFLSKKMKTLVVIFLFGTMLSAQNVEYNFNFNDFSYCSFYEYKIDKSFNSDNSFLNQLKNEYDKKSFFTGDNQLEILSAVSFLWESNPVMIICYQKTENKQVSTHYFYSRDDLKMNFNKIEIVLRLTNDAFWQFYNDINNRDFPEINRLKSLAKDADGMLNLFKLAEIIEKNKNSLSKYFN